MRIYRAILLSFILGLTQNLVAQQKPNVIFILADDMGYGDSGCYGSKLIKTPNIDVLAKEGMRFTDFYAGSTVCAPSRASLMTGQHTGHTFVRGNGEVPLQEDEIILPQILHQAGYVNGMVGKWGLGRLGTTGAPEKKGWDFFSGHLHHIEGHFQHPDSVWQIKEGKSVKIAIPQKKYVNEWFKDEAIRFMQENKSKPFFLYVSFTLPHAELLPSPQFLDVYLNPDGTSKFAPEKAQPAGLHYGPQLYPKAAYAAMITQMDAYVGEITDQLAKLNLDKNTIVIFTSDNGTHTEGGRTKNDAITFFESSGPLKGVKRDLYEGGIREPFIVKWKGKIKKGTTSNFVGAFWDILPTLSDAAGLPIKENTDGISFLPTLLGKSSQQKHANLYWEFTEGGYKQAVRMDNWKAIRFYKNKAPVRTELYNLSTNIGETENVANQNPDIVKQMEAIMDKEHEESKSPLFRGGSDKDGN